MGNQQQGQALESGTLVRRQLPLLGPYVAPRTATERKLAEIWCQALGMDQIGINDGCEDLGGTRCAPRVFSPRSNRPSRSRSRWRRHTRPGSNSRNGAQ